MNTPTFFPALSSLRRLALLSFLLFALHAPFSSTQVEAGVISYPTAEGLAASPDYTVQAGGCEIFTQKTPIASFAAFALDGSVEVCVKVNRPIKRAVIRPLSLGIQPTVEGDTLRFSLTVPCKIAVEVDEDLRRPLFLFVDAPEANAPTRDAPNVRYFEGGKVHEAGTIELHSNETIYLAPGAVVHGVIRADHVTGARILGPGMIDASIRREKVKLAEFNHCTDIEMDGPIVLGNLGWTLVPAFSENVRFKNLKVIGWRDNDDGIDVVSCRNVSVDRCFFRTKDDCISVKALVDTGLSTTAADNFEPVLPPLEAVGPEGSNVDGLHVTRSVFWSSPLGHALTVGFELRAANIRDITFEDCDIIKKENGAALSIDNADFGVVENVRFTNLRVEEGCAQLLMLQVGFFKYSGDCPWEYARRNPARKEPGDEAWKQIIADKRKSPRGKIRDVQLQDLWVVGGHMPGSSIQGFHSPGDITDIRFEKVNLDGERKDSAPALGLRVENASGVTFAK